MPTISQLVRKGRKVLVDKSYNFTIGKKRQKGAR